MGVDVGVVMFVESCGCACACFCRGALGIRTSLEWEALVLRSSIGGSVCGCGCGCGYVC